MCLRNVTSLAEVWIEMLVAVSAPELVVVSLPSRKCGLKFQTRMYFLRPVPSLPSRKCGLKYKMMDCMILFQQVTSLAEVWIEIK